MNTEKSEPKGIIGKSIRNGFPVIWKFVDEPPTDQKRKALPWLAVISWKYDGAGNNGMPPKPINERMLLLESALEKEVEDDYVCEHVISKTGSNLKELIYYINDRDIFIQRLNLALKNHERYPIEIDFHEDREWKEHQNTRSLFIKGEPDRQRTTRGM